MLILSPATATADMAQEDEHQPWSVTGLIKPGQAISVLNMVGRVEGE